MVGGHVEGPFEGLDFYAGCGARDDEGGDALWRAVLAGGAGEDEGVRGAVHAGLPAFVAVDFVAGLAVLEGDGFGAGVHVGGIGAVMDFSQAEGGAELPAGGKRDVVIALLFGAVVVKHDDERVVADDGVLILEVVGEGDAASVDGMGS